MKRRCRIAIHIRNDEETRILREILEELQEPRPAVDLRQILEELQKQTKLITEMAANVQSIWNQIDDTPVGFKINETKL